MPAPFVASLFGLGRVMAMVQTSTEHISADVPLFQILEASSFKNDAKSLSALAFNPPKRTAVPLVKERPVLSQMKAIT